MDPTSHELLDLIVDRARLPVLLVITYLQEFTPPWGSHPHATTLVLNRLGNREVTAIADYVTGKRLPHEFQEQVIGLSDGVPLFVEELVKTALESGLLLELDGEYRLHGPVRPIAVPNTLQGLLTARLDRLGPAKEVAQIGGALGREFSYEVMRAVADWLPEQQLQEALQSLVRSELVYCRGTPPDAVYLFKHALLQDAARETLLRIRRRELHAHIASVLQQPFPEIGDQQPGLLAHHCTEAGLVEESVAYWGRAGRRSADRSAMAEAAAQYQKGLEQLALLPDTSERRRREFEFHAALGAALTIVRGYAAPETGKAFTRARELWAELGSPSEVSEVYFGELHYHQLRGELALSLRLAKDLLRLSIQREDSGGVVLGHGSCGGNLLYMGQFAGIPVASGKGASAVRPNLPSLARRSGGTPSAGSMAGPIGARPLLSGLFGPGSGTYQCSHRRGPEVRTFADSGFDLGLGHLAVADRRGRAPQRSRKRAGRTGDRAGFPPVARVRNGLSRVGSGQKWQRGGGDLTFAQRFKCFPRHRHAGLGTP
jgi:hypothetical protein